MRNDYVVYAYARRNGTFYYIGKGTPDRPYKKLGRGCSTPKDKRRIIILHKDLLESTALLYEKRLIEFYGRRDKKEGWRTLLNRSDGNNAQIAEEYDYVTICEICKSGVKPENLSNQIWIRMKRVSADSKLPTIDLVDLPASLSALVELTRLSEDRFELLRKYQLFGPGMTAENIKEVKDANPLLLSREFFLYPDGKIVLGRVLPIGGRILV